MKGYRVLLSVALVMVVGAIGAFMSWRSPPPEPGYTITRHVKYRFTVENTTNEAIKDARFWAFAPVKQTAFQQTRSIQATHPYALETDALGNQLMRFDLDVLPPFGAKVITVSAELAMSEQPNKSGQVQTSGYLGEEPYVQVKENLIQDKAAQLRGDTEEQTLKNVYDWVSSNLIYAGYIKQDRGALYALKNKRGDCTEYMYLFMALARANGIPVRGVGGYVVSEDAILRARDYHNWVQVYSNERWRNIDPQNKVFLAEGRRYIALRIISRENSDLLPNSHRYAVAGEGLNVRMH